MADDGPGFGDVVVNPFTGVVHVLGSPDCPGCAEEGGFVVIEISMVRVPLDLVEDEEEPPQRLTPWQWLTNYRLQWVPVLLVWHAVQGIKSLHRRFRGGTTGWRPCRRCVYTWIGMAAAAALIISILLVVVGD